MYKKIFITMWIILGLAVLAGLLATTTQDENNTTSESEEAVENPDSEEFVPAEALIIRGSAADLVRNISPAPNGTVGDPLVLSGEARLMYFEASFPVILIDGVGTTVAEGYATAQGDWMTEDFVPFTASIPWKNKPLTSGGTLILKKDNPSDLPANDREAYVAIHFAGYEHLPEGAD